MGARLLVGFDTLHVQAPGELGKHEYITPRGFQAKKIYAPYAECYPPTYTTW